MLLYDQIQNVPPMYDQLHRVSTQYSKWNRPGSIKTLTTRLQLHFAVLCKLIKVQQNVRLLMHNSQVTDQSQTY